MGWGLSPQTTRHLSLATIIAISSISAALSTTPIWANPTPTAPTETATPTQEGGIHVTEQILEAVTPPPSETVISYNFLHQVPVNLDSYLGTETLPSKWTQHGPVVKVLTENRNLALHLEVLRQASYQLPPLEKTKLVEALRQQHRNIPDDPFRYFDYGYVRWSIDHDKSALFYLRKANDQLQNPWSNLAYALAEAEADLTHEHALATELTRRKQDAMFKLQDSLTMQAKAPVTGFWPAYLTAMSVLEKVPAYTDFSTADRSDTLIPFGQRISVGYTLPNFSPETSSQAITDDDDINSSTNTCSRASIKLIENELSQASRTLSIYLDEDTDQADGVYFINRAIATDKDGRPEGYRVVIRRGADELLADIETPVGPYIFEDLDEDGVPEIVIRQFAHNPTKPVSVYRFNGCQFEPDTDIDAIFK